MSFYTGCNGYYPKNKDQKFLVRMWRKENSTKLLVAMEIGVATIEINMVVPQKIKNKIII